MATTTASNVRQLRRYYRGEERWFPLLEELGHQDLRDGFIAAGVAPQVAGGLVWFLDDQMRLTRHQSESSRNRYRRLLETLDSSKVRKLAIGG
jgi:hypothetical protein